MLSNNSQVLNERQIILKIRRIAYEITENHHKEAAIYLLGIGEKGILLSEKIENELSKIFNKKIIRVKNTDNEPNVFFDLQQNRLKLDKKTVIIVDDVMNTGHSVAHAFINIMNYKVKKVEIAVLINRKHTTYPLAATYTGFELATTLNDHIEVMLADKPYSAHLLDKA